jgi:hypothetical protein
MPSQHAPIALITCSFAPDFERCRRLCRSIDPWLSAAWPHTLLVPARDIPLFRRLASAHRSVVAVEDVLPAAYHQLPWSDRWWLGRRGRPVRGWIMQQLTKLSAPAATQAEHIVFVDSDLVFLRPLEADRILRNHRLRLHRVPGDGDRGRHLRWHHRAARLLGEQPRYFGSDYIGQLVTWRRSRLVELHRHIEQVQARPWHDCVAASLEFSEYVLYGVFCEAVLGLEASGHFASQQDLCHCCWFSEDAEALMRGRETLREGAYALLLQSNLGLSRAEEHAVLSRAVNTEPQLEIC